MYSTIDLLVKFREKDKKHRASEPNTIACAFGRAIQKAFHEAILRFSASTDGCKAILGGLRFDKLISTSNPSLSV